MYRDLGTEAPGQKALEHLGSSPARKDPGAHEAEDISAQLDTGCEKALAGIAHSQKQPDHGTYYIKKK